MYLIEPVIEGEIEEQREIATYITTFCIEKELVNPLVIVLVVTKGIELVSVSLDEVTESEEDDPLIKDGVDPQFDEPQLRETIS